MESYFTMARWYRSYCNGNNSASVIKCWWDGTIETEAAIKKETKATIRGIPIDENPKGLSCIYSGRAAKHEVIFAKAY